MAKKIMIACSWGDSELANVKLLVEIVSETMQIQGGKRLLNKNESPLNYRNYKFWHMFYVTDL